MPDLDLARLAPAEFARAAAASFVADVARSPSLEKAISGRSISQSSLKNLILDDLSRGVSGSPGPVLFPNMRSLVRTEISVGEHRLESGMGQFDFGSIVSAVTGIAVGAIQYSSAQSAQRAVLRSQELDVQMAQIQADAAKLQLSAAQGLPSVMAQNISQSISEAASSPIVIALAAAAVGGGIIYMFSR